VKQLENDMTWITSFLSSPYSIGYTLVAFCAMAAAWWISQLRLLKFPIVGNKSRELLLKASAVGILLIISGAFFFGAYQVTSFVHYFSVKKEVPHT
jgi:hypothetical protein